MCDSRERTLQTEAVTRAKALRLECAFDSPNRQWWEPFCTIVSSEDHPWLSISQDQDEGGASEVPRVLDLRRRLLPLPCRSPLEQTLANAALRKWLWLPLLKLPSLKSQRVGDGGESLPAEDHWYVRKETKFSLDYLVVYFGLILESSCKCVCTCIKNIICADIHSLPINKDSHLIGLGGTQTPINIEVLQRLFSCFLFVCLFLFPSFIKV